MDELQIDGKTYVSSKQAAKITGYAKDYVGQLCREGHLDARMVGRSWYVLEESIREHRFGKTDGSSKLEETETPIEKVKEEVEPVSTWKAAQYISEEPALIPSLSERPVQAPVEVVEPVEVRSTLTDMQAAWKEWFTEKQIAPEVLEEEVMEEELEAALEVIEEETVPEPAFVQEEVVEEEEPVALNRISEPEEEEDVEEIPLHRSYESRETGEVVPVQSDVIDLSPHIAVSPVHFVPQAKPMPVVRRSNMALSAVFLTIAAFSVLIALIGSGYAEEFLPKRDIKIIGQEQLFNFFGGASEYENSSK